MDIKPITREEMYLAKAAGQDVSLPEPITRKEMFLAKMAGMEVETPSTFTRLERFANEAAVALNRSVIEPLEITENGTYEAPDGVDGYSPVTVEVVGAGGGGGSLPPGAYWRQIGNPPFQYMAYYFPYKNTTYCLIKTSSSSNKYNLYDYANGAYNLIASNIDSSSAYAWNQFMEYHGKIHAVGYGSYHTIIDGTTVKNKANLPGESLGRNKINIFEWNDYLYAYCKGKLYRWDETSDTWSDSGMINTSDTSNSGYCFIYNDTLYRYYYGILYKYVDGVESQIKQLPKYMHKVEAVYNGIVYMTYLSMLYSYDIANDIYREISMLPHNSGELVSENEKIRYKNGSFHASFMELFEVTE